MLPLGARKSRPIRFLFFHLGHFPEARFPLTFRPDQVLIVVEGRERRTDLADGFFGRDKGEITDEEIERTPRQILSSITLSRQKGTAVSWALAVAVGNASVGRGAGLREYTEAIDRYRAVTTDQVRRLAEQLLSNDQYFRLIIK